MSYTIYHNSFSEAIEEMMYFANDRMFRVCEEDLSTYVTFGSGKPKVGETKKYSLGLYKEEKELKDTEDLTKSKKQIHFQVYGMERKYELNMYIS